MCGHYFETKDKKKPYKCPKCGAHFLEQLTPTTKGKRRGGKKNEKRTPFLKKVTGAVQNVTSKIFSSKKRSQQVETVSSKKQDQQVVVVIGMPEAGKTVYFNVMIDRLRRLFNANDNTGRYTVKCSNDEMEERVRNVITDLKKGE